MLKEINNEKMDAFVDMSGVACTCDCANKKCTPMDSIGASPSESWDVANTQ